MKCLKCDFEYGSKVADFNFCPKCGERLPDLPQLSLQAWKRVQQADRLYSAVRMIAPGLFGAGAALWFVAPAWFDFTETQTLRAVSVGLMVVGALLFGLTLSAMKLAERAALEGAEQGLNKKPASVYLLVDVSTSMRGGKLRGAKQASQSFLSQIDVDQDQLGLITFSDKVTEVHPMGSATEASFALSISALEASGQTALFDAVILGVKRLQQQWDPNRSNVLIAMTDGENNTGNYSLEDIGTTVSNADKPVFIFTVAYGGGADMDVLQQIANWGNGQAYKANRRTIKRLYKLLSAFF